MYLPELLQTLPRLSQGLPERSLPLKRLGVLLGLVKCSQVLRLRTKSSQRELSRGFSGNGVLTCSSDPPKPLLGSTSALKYRACAQNLANWNSPADSAETLFRPAAQTPPKLPLGSTSALKYRACAQNQANWNSPAGTTSGSAARTPHSTRAGGQDAVS